MIYYVNGLLEKTIKMAQNILVKSWIRIIDVKRTSDSIPSGFIHGPLSAFVVLARFDTIQSEVVQFAQKSKSIWLPPVQIVNYSKIVKNCN